MTRCDYVGYFSSTGARKMLEQNPDIVLGDTRTQPERNYAGRPYLTNLGEAVKLVLWWLKSIFY